MSDPDLPAPDTSAAVRETLQQLGPLLRDAHHIEPEVQVILADLVDELVRLVDPAATSSRAEHLAETSTHLIQALHRRQHTGLLTAAKERLEAAATHAAAEAPVATGIARRLVDTLSGLGI